MIASKSAADAIELTLAVTEGVAPRERALLILDALRGVTPQPRVAGLTPKQRELYNYIAGYVRQRGHSPSFDEMTEALGLSSKSGIHRLLLGLEERGWISRRAARARAITPLVEIAA